MVRQILPPSIDNTYRGHALAIWLFVPIVALKVAISLNAILNGEFVARSADGIPLDTFPSAAAATVVAFFALWGLGQLVICVLCVLALVRYRAMVPFMYALVLVEHLSRKLILLFKPVVSTGTSTGAVVNYVLLILMFVGLALSLRGQSPPRRLV
jgi:hypothetical protein